MGKMKKNKKMESIPYYRKLRMHFIKEDYRKNSLIICSLIFILFNKMNFLWSNSYLWANSLRAKVVSDTVTSNEENMHDCAISFGMIACGNHMNLMVWISRTFGLKDCRGRNISQDRIVT